MTEHYETHEKTVQSYKLVKTTCDKCGEEIEDCLGYDVRDFELSFSEGEAYPDGGHRVGWEVNDLCNNCVEWLKKLLVTNGVKVNEIDFGW
jgi:hypothetical protein